MKNTMFNSRLTVMAAAMISSLFLLTGCEKEVENATLPEGAMKISAEASQINDGTKTTVSDCLVNWQDGDLVNVNGNELPVAITDGTPYLMNVDNSSAMYAGFPASAVSLSGSTVTINYPATYEYETAGGVQKLDLPMVAYAAAGSNTLEFIHANSTIEVRVKNSFSSTFTVDSITLVSSSRAISGTGTFNPATFAISVPSPTEANKKVMMTFGSGLAISSGTIKKIQIPVVPDLLSEGTTLTVRIAGAPASVVALNNGKVDAAVKYVYVNSASVSLARASVLPAPCTMNATVPAMKKFYPTFSVSSTKKVYFSKGNLQYIASPSPTWKFADYQWDSRRGDNNSISDSYTGAIDLFGWGTGTAPTTTSTTDGDYVSFNEWGNRTLYGSTNWRTLTSAEWKYLLDTRSGNRFVKAVVNSRNGIIIFPDNYTPSVSFSDINSTSVPYTTNPVSNWSSLEADGCIFLPSTGFRDGTSTSATSSQCAYWTADAFNSANAYRISCTNDGFSYNGATTKKHYGHAVRLVQNAN